MSLDSPHLTVPIALVDTTGGTRAPALAIYGRSAVDPDDIVVTTTQVQLTKSAVTHNVDFPGRTLREVAEEISTSQQEYTAIALNDVTRLNSGDLTKVDGALSHDGGVILHLEGVVVRYREETRVRLLPPYSVEPRLPWFGRIDTGQFVKYHKGIRFIYSVPEYDHQEWSTYFGKPFVDQPGVQPTAIDPHTFLLPRVPLHWRRNNILFKVNEIPQANSLVQDVDEANGLVFLTRDLDLNSVITVDYVYRENTYVYRNINLNPTINHMPQFVGQVVVYYLKPSADDVGRTWNETVFHSVAPSLEGAITQIPVDDIPIVLLGGLVVRQVTTIDEVALTDTRTRGGGIKEEEYEKAVSENRHMLGATDMGTWDVVPYPGNAVVVVDLPSDLKDALTVDEITRRVRRHVAMGVEPVVNFRVSPTSSEEEEAGVDVPDPEFIFDPDTLEVDYGPTFTNDQSLNGTILGWRNTGTVPDDLDFINSAGNTVSWISDVNSSGLPGLTFYNAVGPTVTGSRFYWDDANDFGPDILKLNNGNNGGTANEEITIVFPFCAAAGLLSTSGGGLLAGCRDNLATDLGWWLSINGTGGTPPAQNNIRIVWMDSGTFRFIDPNRTWTTDVWEIISLRMKKLSASSWQVHMGMSELVADQASDIQDFNAVLADSGGGANAQQFNISGDGDFGGRSSFQTGKWKMWASALSDEELDAAITEMADEYLVTIV